MISVGDWAWAPHASHAWVPVCVRAVENGRVVCEADTGDIFHFTAEEYAALEHIGDTSEKDDLSQLESLSEASILYNIRCRYARDQIYSFIGRTLVSVNPFKPLSVFTPAIMSLYRPSSSSARHGSVSFPPASSAAPVTGTSPDPSVVVPAAPTLGPPAAAAPPHIYALAQEAYSALVSSRENQSIIVSGESGAGKTEAAKFVLQYLAEEARRPGAEVDQQLLQANPILESFGNAQTLRNSNSSRFGKWMEVHFDSQNRICGGLLRHYLLEKSRVSFHSPGERNYHAFYQLCASASDEERRLLHLPPGEDGAASFFRYLRPQGAGSGRASTESRASGTMAEPLEPRTADDDPSEDFARLREGYRATVEAMRILDIRDAERAAVFEVLAGILHLGNVVFAAKGDGAVLDPDDSNCSASLDAACRLLGLDRDAVLASLLARGMVIAGERIVKSVSADLAADSRDALAKALYGALFTSLLGRINQTLSGGAATEFAAAAGAFDVPGPSARAIGVLDIFGFETFETNALEQLFINYANEKLQQFFNTVVFHREQEEYAREKVAVERVDLVDRSACLELLEGKPSGVISMLDEELRLPKGGDANLLLRMHAGLGTHPYYQKPRTATDAFSVMHYAGRVEYHVRGFCDKNRDRLEPSIEALVRGSRNRFVASLPVVDASAGARSLAVRFRDQLGSLIDHLGTTKPHFVRCVKPNDHRNSDNFDSLQVCRQLRCLGIHDLVRLRKLGFPVRMDLRRFMRRYRVLSGGPEPAEPAALLAGLGNVSPSDWRVGVSKVFLRQSVVSVLEAARELRVARGVTLFQAAARGVALRRRWKGAQEARVLVARLSRQHDEDGLIPRLEAAIEDYERRGFDLSWDDELLADARTRVLVLTELASCRSALHAAVASAEVPLLRAAIERSEAASLPACPPLDRARRLVSEIAAVDAARALRSAEALRSAASVLSRNPDGPRAVVERAERDAAHMELEAAVLRELVDAAASGDAGRIATALGRAHEAGISSGDEFEAAQRAEQELHRQMLARNKKRADLQLALRQACKVGTLALLEAALASAAEDPAVHVESALVAAATLQRDTVVELLRRLAEARAAGDGVELERALAQADSQISRDEECAERAAVEGARLALAVVQARASLMAAIDAQDEALLETAIGRASGSEHLRVASELSPLVDKARAALLELSQSRLLREQEARDAQRRQTVASVRRATVANRRASQGGARAPAAPHPLSSVPEEDDEARSARLSVSTRLSTAPRGPRSSSGSVTAETGRRDQAPAQSGLAAPPTASAAGASLPTASPAPHSAPPAAAVAAAAVPAMPSSSSAAAAGTAAPHPPASSPLLTVPMQLLAGTLPGMAESWPLHHFEMLRPASSFASGKIFGRQAAKSGMLNHTKDDIPTSLTQIVPEPRDRAEKEYLAKMVDVSVQMFKSVLGFGGDREFSFSDGLASQALAVALKAPLVRDELYVQLLKQLRYNPRHEGAIRVWQLLALLCETCPPTPLLLPYVAHLLHGVMAAPTLPGHTPLQHDVRLGVAVTSEAKGYGRFCLEALAVTLNATAPRGSAPDMEYVSRFRVRSMGFGSARIHFADGSCVTVKVGPSTTAGGAVAQAAEAVGLRDARGLALFLSGRRGVEDLVVDATSYLLECEPARADVARDDAQLGRPGRPEEARLVVRRVLFPEGPAAQRLESDPKAAAMAFYQAAESAAKGLLFLGPEKVAEVHAVLSTLRQHSRLPRLGPTAACPEVLAGLLRAPASLFTSGQSTEKKFAALVDAARQRAPTDATLVDLLRLAASSAAYGYQCFSVTVEATGNDLQLPRVLILGVGLGGIVLGDWNDNKLLCRLPLPSVLGWKGTSSQAVLKLSLGDGGSWTLPPTQQGAAVGLRQAGVLFVTLTLSTSQGRTVAALLNAAVAAVLASTR